jgi:hypothetical protein
MKLVRKESESYSFKIGGAGYQAHKLSFQNKQPSHSALKPESNTPSEHKLNGQHRSVSFAIQSNVPHSESGMMSHGDNQVKVIAKNFSNSASRDHPGAAQSQAFKDFYMNASQGTPKK